MLKNLLCRFFFFFFFPQQLYYFFTFLNKGSQTIRNISVVIIHSTKEQKEIHIMDGLKKTSSYVQVSSLPSS